MMVKKTNSKVSIPTVIQSSSSQTLDEDKDLNGPGKSLLNIKTNLFERNLYRAKTGGSGTDRPSGTVRIFFRLK